MVLYDSGHITSVAHTRERFYQKSTSTSSPAPGPLSAFLGTAQVSIQPGFQLRSDPTRTVERSFLQYRKRQERKDCHIIGPSGPAACPPVFLVVSGDIHFDQRQVAFLNLFAPVPIHGTFGVEFGSCVVYLGERFRLVRRGSAVAARQRRPTYLFVAFRSPRRACDIVLWPIRRQCYRFVSSAQLD